MSAGSIIVDLILRTGSFSTDTERSAKDLAKLKKEAYETVRAIGDSIKGLAAAAGVGLSIAGFTALIKSTIDANDHLTDLSKKTGIAVETLGGIGFAASQAGGDIESATAAAGKLNKALAEAAAGNQLAGEAFKALGINVRDASGETKKADVVLAEVADKFKTYEDGPEKAALALRLFGKAGADIIPLLDDGGDALRKNIEYFKRYSGVTKETAEQSDAFNDTLVKIKLLSGATAQSITAELLPSLQTIADEFVHFKESGDGFKGIAEGINSLFKIVVGVGADVGFVLLSIGREIGAITAQLGALAHLDFNAFSSISDAVKEDGKRARAELDAFKRRLNTDLSSLPQASYSHEGGVAMSSAKKAAPRITDIGSQDNAEAILKKSLDGQIKLISDFAKQQKEGFDFANKYLDAVYSDGIISLQAYFDDQKALRDAALAAQLAGYDKEIAAQREYIAKTAKEAEKIGARAKIAELQQQRGGAVQKASQDDILAERQRQRAIRDTQDQYQQLIATIDKARGDNAGAAAIEIAKQVREATELVTKAGGDPAIIGVYRAQLQGISDLAIAQKDYGKLLDSQANKEANLLLDAQNSGKGELQTLAAVRDSRQAAIAQLGAMADSARELAATLNTDESRKFADDLALAFKKASAEIDPLAQKFNSIFEDSFGNAFAGFITGAKSAKDAFKDFATSVISELANIAAKDLAKTIFGQGNGQGGIGGLLSGLSGLFSGGSVPAGAGSSAGDVSLGGSYGLAIGTNYVPYDGFKATLHKGEAVVPAKFNPSANGAIASLTPRTAGMQAPANTDGGARIQVVNPPGVPLQASATQEQQPDGSTLRRIILSTVSQDFDKGGQAARSAAGRFGLRSQLPRRGR